MERTLHRPCDVRARGVASARRLGPPDLDAPQPAMTAHELRGAVAEVMLAERARDALTVRAHADRPLALADASYEVALAKHTLLVLYARRAKQRRRPHNRTRPRRAPSTRSHARVPRRRRVTTKPKPSSTADPDGEPPRRAHPAELAGGGAA